MSQVNLLQYLSSWMKCKLIGVFALLMIIRAESLQQLGVILIHSQESQSGAVTAYITALTKTKCPFIGQFNILSSHRQSKEISQLQATAPSLPIPVHFDFSFPSNTTKLRIAEDSNAELYFIGNLAGETCNEIQQYLEFSHLHEAAGLIPLIGEFEQASVVTVDNSQKTFSRYFGYAKDSRLKHYQIVENIRMISRHTLQLAASAIREVKLMADHPPACQEIFLNFIHAHFYPQLRSRLYKFSKRLEVAVNGKIVEQKTQCIRSFIEILGYCPLFYQKKVFTGKIWKNPNFQEVVELKKVALESQLLIEKEGRLLMIEIRDQSGLAIEGHLTFYQVGIIFALLFIMSLLLAAIFLLRSKISKLSAIKQYSK